MNMLLSIAASLLLTTSVYAATATPAATATTSPTPNAEQKLDTLKDRLASAATQLKQSQKRAIFGTVKATSVSTITVSTKTSDVKIELTDAIGVFQVIKGKRTTLTTENLAKSDDVVVFGDYDANLDILKAKVIFIQDAIPVRIAGEITAINKKDFTVTVTTHEGKSYIVDIETTTKSFSWDPTGGLAKSAFSKLLVADTVHVLGTPNAKTEDRISAARILDIGSITGAAPTPTAEATTTPTPTTTPKPTAKPTATPTP